jgi:hypothetical protein
MVGEDQGRQFEQFIEITQHDNHQKSDVLIHDDLYEARFFFHNIKAETIYGSLAGTSQNDFPPVDPATSRSSPPLRYRMIKVLHKMCRPDFPRTLFRRPSAMTKNIAFASWGSGILHDRSPDPGRSNTNAVHERDKACAPWERRRPAGGWSRRSQSNEPAGRQRSQAMAFLLLNRHRLRQAAHSCAS